MLYPNKLYTVMYREGERTAVMRGETRKEVESDRVKTFVYCEGKVGIGFAPPLIEKFSAVAYARDVTLP